MYAQYYQEIYALTQFSGDMSEKIPYSLASLTLKCNKFTIHTIVAASEFLSCEYNYNYIKIHSQRRHLSQKQLRNNKYNFHYVVDLPELLEILSQTASNFHFMA